MLTILGIGWWGVAQARGACALRRGGQGAGETHIRLGNLLRALRRRRGAATGICLEDGAVSGSPLVQAIQERLRSGGYSDLSTPFKVAGVEFAFTGAMRGRDGRALDLVLLVDTTTGDFGDRDGGRVRQRVEALSRALDVTGSRYVVTVILAGAVLAQGIEALSETCRVLQVEGVALDDEGKPADETAKRQLDDRIRVLLPLTLPAPPAETQDGSGPAMGQLARALPAGMEKALVDKVIAASSAGEQAVTDAVALLINGAFQSEPGREQS